MLRQTPDEVKQEFQEVALPYADSLYNFAFRMTRNRRDAEDLVQDTFMRAFRFFHRFETGTNIRAWLFRILKNTYINNYRKVQRTPDQVDWAQVEDFYDSVTPDDLRKRHKNPEELLLEKSVDGRVEEAMADLPPEYRAVVLLNFMEDMSYKEIAEILEIPMGTVMSRLHRGRKILQQKLRDYAVSTNLLPSLREDGDTATNGRVVPMDPYRRRATGK
ncbi:MAG: sigma-70 family RNA polymerase sigma factor [Acidobacteria bacterium]|nr:sigma-70 family RNA polymerase sigma factor [Acidobacteriota bacterium]